MRPNSEISLLSEGKREFYDPRYPWALALADEAEAAHWRWNQTNIKEDFNDLKVKLTKEELHGVREVLRLFTLYETEIGQNYWQGIVSKHFPHPEIRMMCARFAYEEFGIHARAYAAIGDVLGELDEDHMTSWKQSEALVARMDFLDSAAALPKSPSAMDLVKSIGTFALIEGAVLSSSFAFLKHFKANGKNLLSGIVEAVNYSLQDEIRHYTAGSMLVALLIKEADLTSSEIEEVSDYLQKVVRKTLEHESIIVDRIFQEGPIAGIEAGEVIALAHNQCIRILDLMGIAHGMEREETPVEAWYFTNAGGLKMADHFAVQSTAYSHNWTRGKF